MGMCKKRMLSFILTLALMVGCFACTGISVKAADVEEDIVVLATAVSGDVPVEGVEFELLDTGIQQGDEGYIVATIVSDSDGKLKDNIAQLQDSTYDLKMVSSEDYSVTDTTYRYKVMSKKIILAGEAMDPYMSTWTGDENFKFDLKKEDSEPDLALMKIRLIDKLSGKLLKNPEVYLQVTNQYLVDNPGSASATRDLKSDNGEFVYKMDETWDGDTTITIGLHPDVKGYKAESLVLTTSWTGITKINGTEDYDGRTPVEMVVTKEGAADITKVEAESYKVLSSGGTVKIVVEGTNLTADNWGISAESVIRDTKKPCDAAKKVEIKDFTATGVSVTIPENETSDVIDYIFSVGPNDEEGEVVEQKTLTITQAGKEQGGDKPQDPDDKPQDPDDKPQTPGNDKPQDDNKPALPETIKVSSIKLSAASKEIAVGKKIKLTTKVFPANATNKSVTYKSSNTKYASVDGTGKVTVKKAGAGKTVTITATAADGSGKSASYKIKIMKSAVKSIKVKAAKSVKAGKKVKAKVTVKTTGKNANKKLKWTSSNTKYATVSSKGVIKTKKAGRGKTVKITAAATDGSGKKSTVKIKIK